jgi:hypothetical protein
VAPTNITALVPRVRRAIEKFDLDVELTEDEVKDVTADALSAIVLRLGSLFGKSLDVVDRDVNGAPVGYETSEPLSLAESTVVANQAALEYFTRLLPTRRTSESIGDEAQTWSVQTSAQALVETLRQLRAERDGALEAVSAMVGVDRYTSFLAVRDRYTSLAVERYVYARGMVGQEGDLRFGTASW